MDYGLTDEEIKIIILKHCSPETRASDIAIESWIPEILKAQIAKLAMPDEQMVEMIVKELAIVYRHGIHAGETGSHFSSSSTQNNYFLRIARQILSLLQPIYEARHTKELQSLQKEFEVTLGGMRTQHRMVLADAVAQAVKKERERIFSELEKLLRRSPYKIRRIGEYADFWSKWQALKEQ